jgi:hypothetical protein
LGFLRRRGRGFLRWRTFVFHAGFGLGLRLGLHDFGQGFELRLDDWSALIFHSDGGWFLNFYFELLRRPKNGLGRGRNRQREACPVHRVRETFGGDVHGASAEFGGVED